MICRFLESEDIIQGDQLLNSPVKEVSASPTRFIGIIRPPPDIRTIVDTTVQYVARLGHDFVKWIVDEKTGNIQFGFLNSCHPYHGYYQQCLSNFLHGQNQKQDQPPPQPGTEGGIQGATHPEIAQKSVEQPETEKYTVQLPKGIHGEDLELIKLTAIFAACNGSCFWSELNTREIDDPKFSFMKPNDAKHEFFSSLVHVYSRVLTPPEGLLEKLKKSVSDMPTVLERCKNRMEWDLMQEQNKKNAADEMEQERIQMGMIDWHNFVVAGTIDFADDEDQDLPPPMTLEQVISRSKIKLDDTMEPGKDVEMEIDEGEAQLAEEGMKTAMLKAEEPERQPQLRVVKNWKRPEERIHPKPTELVVPPGKLLPPAEISGHLRDALLLPKYKKTKKE